jgi:hypothetical protein
VTDEGLVSRHVGSVIPAPPSREAPGQHRPQDLGARSGSRPPIADAGDSGGSFAGGLRP